MPDVTESLRRATPVLERLVVAGYVSTSRPAPTAFGEPLYVIVPSYSTDFSYGPCEWGALHGETLPKQGAPVRVAFDDRGVPVVVWWDGTTSFQPAAPVYDTTGLTSAQIDALFAQPPANGSLLADAVNAWLLVRLSGSWYRTAALTHIP